MNIVLAFWCHIECQNINIPTTFIVFIMYLDQLIALANMLDATGYNDFAARVDGIIKTARRKSIMEKIKNRFWSKVEKTTECWIWIGAKSNGYGVCSLNGKTYFTHRLSWEWANNKSIPDGCIICHSCDNPSCVNPEHLRADSVQSNVNDRVERNRSAKGKNNGQARLTEKDVKDIKVLRNKGWTEKAIADLYDVSRSTISHILHGRTWFWL